MKLYKRSRYSNVFQYLEALEFKYFVTRIFSSGSLFKI